MIRVKQLYDAKLKTFGATSSQERFIEVFMDSLRKVLSDLSLRCHIDSISVESLNDELSLSQDFYTAISEGLDLYIQDANEYSVKDKRDVQGRYDRSMRWLQAEYFMDSDNEVYAKLGDLS